MEDPNLIAILLPVAGKNDYAENAFRLEHNINRCLAPTQKTEDEGPTISSREPTPARSLQMNDEHDDNQENRYRLRLNFTHEPPKDPTKGFAFGTDKQKCDVLLAPRGVRDTSGVHFHITFDVIRGKRYLVLRDSSTNGTAVSYSGQAEKEVRHHFTWILDLEGTDGKAWEIKVHVRGLVFKVQFASHQTCEAEYKKNVGKFLKHSQTADPFLSGLSINNYTTEVAPSQSRTPGQRPVYIHEQPLGKGSFGQVDRVIDVSTGAIYARKIFLEPPWATGKERRRLQREEWLDRIRREIRIMMEHPHELIVPIVDFQEDPRPFSVMPYFSLGSLNDEHHRDPLAEGETVSLLFQGLTMLEHLHSRGVAYRDLKPENILVKCRSPLHLRFTDFGLANDQPDLKTFCGTEKYCAPEIYTGGNYTTAVDIWSLGVIVLEYVYGLPRQQLQARAKEEAAIRTRGLAWCRLVVQYVEDWDPDALIDLLTTAMLRMEPRERLPAGACLTKACELGLFDDLSAGSGGTTTTPRTAPASGAQNEEETPTVTAGLLQHARRGSLIHDSADQVGPSASDRCPLTPTGSIRPGPKRYRSPAANSPGNLSDKSRVKRRPAEALSTGNRASCASKSPSPDPSDDVSSP